MYIDRISDKICPILSIDDDWLDCKQHRCQLWNTDKKQCSVYLTAEAIPEALDRAADALDRVAMGMTYSPRSEVPSIPESICIAADGLNKIADAIAEQDAFE